MNGIGPTISLVFFKGLTRQRRPARLRTHHSSVSRVGPENTMNGAHRGLEPVIAATKCNFALLAAFDVDNQDVETVDHALRRRARNVANLCGAAFAVWTPDHSVRDDNLTRQGTVQKRLSGLVISLPNHL